MQHLYLISFIITILGFTSCADINRSEQVNTINLLSKTIDSMEIVLKEHHIAPIHETSMEYAEIEEKISQNIEGKDTISLDFARKLDQLKQVKFNFRPLENNFIRLEKFISEEKQALANLKDDIENGNGERENYSKNILQESKKVTNAKQTLLDYTTKRQKALEVFNQYKDELTNFADTL